jgi:hypothetical protein
MSIVDRPEPILPRPTRARARGRGRFDQLQREDASQGLADDMRARYLQVVHQAQHVVDHFQAMVSRIVWLAALAMAAEVKRDDTLVVTQRLNTPPSIQFDFALKMKP